MKSSLFKGISIAMIVAFSALLIYYFVHLSVVNIGVELTTGDFRQDWFGTVLLIITSVTGLLSGIIGLTSYSVSVRYIVIVLTIVLRVCVLFVLHSSFLGLVISFGLPIFYLVGLFQEVRTRSLN